MVTVSERPVKDFLDAFLNQPCVSFDDICEGVDNLFAEKSEPTPPQDLVLPPSSFPRRKANELRKSNFRPLDKKEAQFIQHLRSYRRTAQQNEWYPRNRSERARFIAAGLNPSTRFHPLTGVPRGKLKQALAVLAWHRSLWMVQTGMRDEELTQAEWTNRLRRDFTGMVDSRFNFASAGGTRQAIRPDWLTQSWLDELIDTAAMKSWKARHPLDGIALQSNSKWKAGRNTDTTNANLARADKKADRQTRICNLLLQGLKQKEVAKAVGVSTRTVKQAKHDNHHLFE